MCGIIGLAGQSSDTDLQRMAAAVRHRGPDSDGFYRGVRFRLGVQRLSIVDATGGTQPIYNEDGDKCIVFNGEIYNHDDLRRDLQRRGHIFRSKCDTEVVLHLYEEYGVGCLQYLKGMFAFAIADGSILFIARDRVGIKPLYFTTTLCADRFAFSSEIKALLQLDWVTSQLSHQSVVDTIVLGYPAGRSTMFEHIDALQPGHYLIVRDNNGRIDLETHVYYSPTAARDHAISIQEAECELFCLLKKAVERQLPRDLDHGLILSGGLDSGLLAGLLYDIGDRQFACFSIGTTEYFPDITLARDIAAKVETPHFASLLSDDEFSRLIPACIVALEMPTLTALPLLAICHHIAGFPRVCLMGEGADELFGGYPDYTNPAVRLNSLRRRLPLIERTGLELSPTALHIVSRLLNAADLSSYLDALFSINMGDQLAKLHLEVSDKCSMSSGIEFRVPYLDEDVIRFVNCLPLGYLVRPSIGIGKYILRRVALRQYPDLLIDQVLRPKVGLPGAGWTVLQSFRRWCEGTLADTYQQRHPLRGLVDHKADLVILDLFEELMIRYRGTVPPGFDIHDFIAQRSSAPAARA